MSTKTQLSAFEQYLQAGDSPLPVDSLMQIYDSLGSVQENNSERRPATLLIAADACIDLAVQTNDSELWIANAENVLERLVNRADRSLEQKDYSAYRKASQTVVNAYFRQAEVRGWESAALGLDTEANYGFALNAARLAGRLCHLGSGGVRGRVIEYIPVLLGSRAQYRDMPEAWNARTALQREDLAHGSRRRRNPNWDTGVSFDNSSDRFVNPELKLQIARSRKKLRHTFVDAGVEVLIAKTFGIDDPESIIRGCLSEIGIRTNTGEGVNTPSTDKLDDITGNLYQEFVRMKNPDTV
ncbi:MAG: hypothetical protein QG628_1048 [Patescibacteria group bacterium]|nr:hypothetical protein [Patescibacteria group bacterium]